MLEAAVDGAHDHARRRGSGVADAGAPENRSRITGDAVRTQRGKEMRPQTAGQRRSCNRSKNTLTFGIGPAGTGKTFLAVVMAVRALKDARGLAHDPLASRG